MYRVDSRKEVTFRNADEVRGFIRFCLWIEAMTEAEAARLLYDPRMNSEKMQHINGVAEEAFRHIVTRSDRSDALLAVLRVQPVEPEPAPDQDDDDDLECL